MGYRDSEHYGYVNGKLLWFAYEGLYNLISDAVFGCCGNCRKRNPEDDFCVNCIAFKAEPILEKQIIEEGVKFMTNLVKEWKQANNSDVLLEQ